MTVELYRQRLTRAQLHPNDRQWMPMWLAHYPAQQSGTRCQRLAYHEARF